MNKVTSEMLKYPHYVITLCRDSQHETPDLASNSSLEPEPTFSEDKVIPFKFTIKMPPPRHYPEILKRDQKGRIETSKFPVLAV